METDSTNSLYINESFVNKVVSELIYFSKKTPWSRVPLLMSFPLYSAVLLLCVWPCSYSIFKPNRNQA